MSLSEMVHVASGLVAIAGGFVLIAFGAAALQVALRQRQRRREVELWRRNRPRARLLAVVFAREPLTGESVAVPVFAPGSTARPLDADPITAEPVQYGWSDSEIKEVMQRPSEFFVE
jgi:hypothetical protein